VRVSAVGVLAGAAVLVAGGVVVAQLVGDDVGADVSFTDEVSLEVATVAGGLDHPWDVHAIDDGRLLVTERDRATLSLVADGAVTPLAFPSEEVWVSGETGLMGLEVDPDFTTNRRIYTCQGGFTADGGTEVHVVAWTVDDAVSAVSDPQELVGGLPTSSGRHGGCRLLIGADGDLYVGTGDAAQGENPRDLTSLGGKTLRLDRFSGEPAPENPFADAEDEAQRYVNTFGHRNVQGLAQRADGSLWSAEHGPDRDDEVNLLVPGGDYGWHPVPGYDELVPMTDQELPGDQVDAAWSSGNPTIAVGGATFVAGSQWGDLEGTLAMAVLKDEAVLFLRFDDDGALQDVVAPAQLHELGRIRTVSTDTDGTLLVATDNGDGQDAIYRVSPSP
jgi:glucose/arabinose dehydrogenase